LKNKAHEVEKESTLIWKKAFGLLFSLAKEEEEEEEEFRYTT
jgi:hypothetical protein